MSSPQLNDRAVFSLPVTPDNKETGLHKSEPLQVAHIAAPCKAVRDVLSALSEGKGPDSPQEVLQVLAGRGLLTMRITKDFELSESRRGSLERAEAALAERAPKIADLLGQLERLGEQIRHLSSKTRGLSGVVSWFRGDLPELKQELEEKSTNRGAIEASLRRLQLEREREQRVVAEITQERQALANQRKSFVEVDRGETYVRITNPGIRFTKFMSAYGDQINAMPFDAFERGCHRLEATIQEKLAGILNVTSDLVAKGFHETVAREVAFASIFYAGKESFPERAMEVSRAVEESSLPFRDFMQAVTTVALRDGEPAALISDVAQLYEVAVPRGLHSGSQTLQLMVSIMSGSADRPSAEARIARLLKISEQCERLCRDVGVPEHAGLPLATRLFSREEVEGGLASTRSLFEGLVDGGLPRTPQTLLMAATLSALKHPVEKIVAAATTAITTVSKEWGTSAEVVSAGLSLGMSSGALAAQMMIVEDLVARLKDLGFQRSVLSKAVSLARGMRSEAAAQLRGEVHQQPDEEIVDQREEPLRTDNEDAESLAYSHDSTSIFDQILLWAPLVWLTLSDSAVSDVGTDGGAGDLHEVGVNSDALEAEAPMIDGVDSGALEAEASLIDGGFPGGDAPLEVSSDVLGDLGDFGNDSSGGGLDVDFGSSADGLGFDGGTSFDSSGGYDSSSSYDSGGSYDSGSSSYDSGSSSYDGGGYSSHDSGSSSFDSGGGGSW